jgi:hypothetical protein
MVGYFLDYGNGGGLGEAAGRAGEELEVEGGSLISA